MLATVLRRCSRLRVISLIDVPLSRRSSPAASAGAADSCAGMGCGAGGGAAAPQLSLCAWAGPEDSAVYEPREASGCSGGGALGGGLGGGLGAGLARGLGDCTGEPGGNCDTSRGAITAYACPVLY